MSNARKGSISVNTGDIFPIIKKWLYSEHDIFLRELVSNACDAITKRETLSRNSNKSMPEGKISIEIDKPNKQIRIHDNGLGMTEAEVEKYIAQLAFSGAEEFVNQMKDIKSTDSKDEIIGKFGLGFYSSFMVSDKVEIESLSMNEGAKPIKWSCHGDTDYEFTDSDKQDVGTTITLHINEESKDFLENYKTRSTLTNYCDFMPYTIELIDVARRKETFEENLKAKKEEDKKKIEIDIINETTPLWRKDASSLTDEDYKTFYKKMFPMDQDPLFWVHLNIDYPFTLQGILFFPKYNPSKPFNENNIRLYSKQVFVSDNVKNVVPEFLSLLKGAIDSSDIPLNVSRSSLQGDPNIKKISNYIVKKVGESLKKKFNNDREAYEKAWEDIGLFVKYGCTSDTKFDELMRQRVLFETADKKYLTLEEYSKNIPKEFEDKLKNKVIFAERNATDAGLISQLTQMKIPFIFTDNQLDPHLLQHIEYQKQGEQELKFTSIDEVFETLFDDTNTNAQDVKVKEFFEKALGTKEDDLLEVEIKNLSSESTPMYFKVDQNMKRFQQMSRSMGQNQNIPLKKTLVLNPTHPIVKNVFKLAETGKDKLANKMATHLKDLANFSNEELTNDQKTNFVQRSQDLLNEISTLAL